VLGVRRWRELMKDRKEMERYCSTGQSPQRAAAPTEEEIILNCEPLVNKYRYLAQGNTDRSTSHGIRLK